MDRAPLITNDAVVLGILMVILGLVFYTSSRPSGFWKKFYGIVPSLLLCYFLPSLLATGGVISAEESGIYFVASRFLLPTSLLLLTLSIDLKGVIRLGPKALIMFITGTTGVVIGGPLAIIVISFFNPEVVGGEGVNAVWRGLTTVAGSWIGGGANQVAMKEVFQVGDRIFSALIAVDVIVANLWMACLLFAAGRQVSIDAHTGADTRAIDDLKEKISSYQAQIMRIPKLPDTMAVLAVGFAVTAFAHLCADALAPWLYEVNPALERFSLTSNFFWIVVIATTLGVVLSNTRVRKLEGVGASRLGSAFLYVLVASIGMKMDLRAIFEHTDLFIVGLIWIAFHAGLMIVVARLIRAPVFFLAVGSQANIGGAASAPIVASAFHPSLATVGVLLAVVGYALGTYMAWVCGIAMQYVSP